MCLINVFLCEEETDEQEVLRLTKDRCFVRSIVTEETLDKDKYEPLKSLRVIIVKISNILESINTCSSEIRR